MLSQIHFLPHAGHYSAGSSGHRGPTARKNLVPDPPTAASTAPPAKPGKLTTPEVWALYLGRISHYVNTGLVPPNKSFAGSFFGGGG